MSSLEHTDPTFASDTPPLSAAEPPLPFVRTPRRRFPTRSRQNHSSDTARERRVFVLDGSKATIGGGEIRGVAEDRDVAIQRGRPQRHVGRSCRMDLIGRDDLMLAFLDRHELPKFRGFRDFPFAYGLGVRFKHAQHLVGHVDVAAKQTRAGLLLKEFRTLAGNASILLALLLSVSLLVAGIGVLNAVMTSVIERTSEIGLRRAVGATRRQIAQQFLVESLLVTTLGSSTGICVGLLLLVVACRALNFPVTINVGMAAFALIASLVMGLLSGVGPAVRAGRLTPTDALRRE